MGKTERKTQVLDKVVCCGDVCLWCSALEMYLRQQDRCLSDELCQLKEKVETLRRQGGGGVGDDGTDSEERPLWEVLEQSKPSEDLLKYEQQVEDAIHRLEDFSF